MDQIINLILHGIVHLMNDDCVSCFKKWLIAFDILEGSGSQSSIMKLFDTLFPKHYLSFDEIIQNFSIEGHIHPQSNLRQSFSNFTAFKCSGILYYMWYSMGNNSVLEGKKITETIELNREISSEETGCSSVQIINESTYECYRDEKDFYSCISWLASVLLSGSHISYVTLQLELTCVEGQLLELDIKKRLHDHILSRKQIGAQSQVDICKTTKIEKVDDIPKEVNQLCERMVNVTTKVDRSNGSHISSHCGKHGFTDYLENEMLSDHLTRKKVDLLGTLASFPSEIKVR